MFYFEKKIIMNSRNVSHNKNHTEQLKHFFGDIRGAMKQNKIKIARMSQLSFLTSHFYFVHILISRNIYTPYTLKFIT